jgi:hypothetical protein
LATLGLILATLALDLARRVANPFPLRAMEPTKDVNPVETVFLYLPFPYWAGFVLLLYGHDLPRLRHPVRDDGSTGNWWAVLNQLGLLSDYHATRKGRSNGSLGLYFAVPSASFGLSIACTFHFLPSAWYFLILIQAAAGIVMTAVTVRNVGPPPGRYYKDFLAYPRLGSRISHLAKLTPLAVTGSAPKPEKEPSPGGSGQPGGAKA